MSRPHAPGKVPVAVIGAGPAGLVTSLALARVGVPVSLVAPAYDADLAGADQRTTALIGPSVALLENLGVWRLCKADAAAIEAVRIADDRGGIVRVPELVFRARELGVDSFGANIANPCLLGALNTAVEAAPGIVRITTAGVKRIEPELDHVRLHLAEGSCVTAHLVAAADGRNSIAPAGAGISFRKWEYPQAAVVTSFGHTRAHTGVVYELHRRHGPLTTVPMQGLRSSLVWAEEPSEARRLASLDAAAFAEHLEQRLQGVLGTLRDIGPRGLYPLSGASADCLARQRVALVGEAAHVIPPIGAQGLNLGLRDAAALADCAAEAMTRGQQLGGEEMLASYRRARASDVALRSATIDLLNRSLLTDFLPLDLLRGVAGHSIAGSSWLRRLLMQGGMGSAEPLPRLMRPPVVTMHT